MFGHGTALSLHVLSDFLTARVHLSVPASWRPRPLPFVATRAATFTVHPSPPSVVTLRAPVSAPIGLHVHLVAYGGSLRFALWFERAGGPAPFQAPRLRDTGATRHPAQLTHRERPACLPRDAFDRACARHEFGYRNYGAGGLALDTTEGRRTRVDVTCPVCPPPRRAGRARSTYPMPPGVFDRERLQLLRMLGLDVSGLIGEPAAPEAPCPHAPMRHEAFGALFAAFPELAFEATQLLIAAPTLTPPRFVLSPAMMRGLVGAWLMGRARPGALPRAITRAPAAPTLDDDARWSEAQRAAEAFARGAWGFDGPLRAADDGAGATPVLAAGEALPDVALMWPDGVARPAPRPPEAAPPKPPKVKKPTAPKRPKAEAKGTSKPAAAKPTPGQELMTPELRALGYSDAAIKGLLQDGTIERAGYGWYRWKG